jgi:quercetin dioxygenase-like cupin family protein
MTMNRREAFGVVSAFALMGTLAEGQTSETAAMPLSKVYKFDDFPVTHNPAGAEGRAIPKEAMPLGAVIGVHISTVAPGKEFAPMRRLAFHEFRMVREGKLEFLIEGKPPQIAEAGDIVFCAANEMAQVRNSSDKPVSYFAVMIAPPKAATS